MRSNWTSKKEGGRDQSTRRFIAVGGIGTGKERQGAQKGVPFVPGRVRGEKSPN